MPGLRNWRQKFDRNALFVFRRRLVLEGVQYGVGDVLPPSLLKNRVGKLRNMWNANYIELAPEGTVYEQPDGGKQSDDGPRPGDDQQQSDDGGTDGADEKNGSADAVPDAVGEGAADAAVPGADAHTDADDKSQQAEVTPPATPSDWNAAEDAADAAGQELEDDAAAKKALRSNKPTKPRRSTKK